MPPPIPSGPAKPPTAATRDSRVTGTTSDGTTSPDPRDAVPTAPRLGIWLATAFLPLPERVDMADLMASATVGCPPTGPLRLPTLQGPGSPGRGAGDRVRGSLPPLC